MPPQAPQSHDLAQVLGGRPVFVNVGVQAFGESLRAAGCEVLDVDWTPPAGGNPELAALLDDLL